MLNTTSGDSDGSPIAGYSDDELLRNITVEERETYFRDGVVHLVQIIPEHWITRLRCAVDALMSDVDHSSQNYTPPDEPRFFSQAFARFVNPTLNTWALHGPTKSIAAQLHPQTQTLRFFYDQVFAQEPCTTTGAPYHQDYPYLPIAGDQYFRIWVPLDIVTADSGAIRYLKGSHRGPLYRPVSFSNDPNVISIYANSPYPEPPGLSGYDDDAWVIGEAIPRDALIHHPKTVHGSPPNRTGYHRRAVTTIFIGDDVTWDPRPGTAFDHIGPVGSFRVPTMQPGQPVDDAMFPVVYHRSTRSRE